MMKRLLVIICALAVSSLACAASVGGSSIAWDAPTSTPEGVVTATPSPSPAPTATATSIASPQYAVCTGVPGGRLHVRFAPGDTSAVRGYALEAESLVVSGARREMDDSRWIEITSPVHGWINQKYICNER